MGFADSNIITLRRSIGLVLNTIGVGLAGVHGVYCELVGSCIDIDEDCCPTRRATAVFQH
jgi:hypothetical protein